MKFFILVALFISLACDAFAAPKPEEWEVTQVSDQTFVFDKKKTTVMVDIDYIEETDETVSKFIRSSEFVKAMKLLRKPELMELEGEEISVTSTRKQYGTTYVGITESLFKIGDRSAVLTEHWWVKSNLTFHVSVLSRGNFSQSNEEQEKIFEPFARDLGLIQQTSAFLSFVVPTAYAELNRNGRTPGRTAPTQGGAGAKDCQRDFEEMGIPQNLARSGPPTFAPSFSLRNCGQALGRIWGETKKAALDLGADFVKKTGSWRQFLGCRGVPPPPKFERGATAGMNWQTVSRWTRNVTTGVRYVRDVAVDGVCTQVAATATTLQMAGSAVVSTASGIVSLGRFLAETQVRQANSIIHLIRYGKVADDDPMVAMARMIGEKWTGFKCLTNQEQAIKICKVATELVATGASMFVGVGAARLARIASVVGKAIEAEQAASKAAMAARLARASGRADEIARTTRAAQVANREREAAAAAVRNANMNSFERKFLGAPRALGRTPTMAERRVIQAAHKVGKPGPDGKYSVGDLREKYRIMTEGGLSREDALKLLRSGITGEASPSSIAAATTAATETRAPSLASVTRAADAAENQTMELVGDFGRKWRAGDTTGAMESLRRSRQTAREAARGYEEAGALGKSPSSYKSAMSNYLDAGDGRAAASARLTAVRTLGESPQKVIAELRSIINTLEKNPKTATDTYQSQRLATYRTALREFEAGADNAVAQFERSGAVRVAGTEYRPPTPVTPRPVPEVPAKPATPVAAVERAPVPQQPVAARVQPSRNDPFLNLAQSLKTDGNVAVSMVNEAISSRSPEKLNKIVEDLEAALPRNPTPEQSAQTLRAVQAIRAQDAMDNLTTGNASRLQSLERRFTTPENNPAGLVERGNVDAAVRVYRERLSAGWQRQVVEREIRGEIQRATMMRDAIARQRVRIKDDTKPWQLRIDANQRILRELAN